MTEPAIAETDTGKRSARSTPAPAPAPAKPDKATVKASTKAKPAAPPKKAAPAVSKAPAPAAAGGKKRAEPAKAAVPATSAATAEPAAKLVRDSFTMPQSDFALIAALKQTAIGFQRPAKKSELLRAGLQVLATLSKDDLKTALDRLSPIKTGRPKRRD